MVCKVIVPDCTRIYQKERISYRYSLECEGEKTLRFFHTMGTSPLVPIVQKKKEMLGQLRDN